MCRTVSASRPDERTLYVANSGTPRHIRAFAVDAAGGLDAGRVFAAIDKGSPDGISAMSSGMSGRAPAKVCRSSRLAGQRIARILLPESAANLAFGGPRAGPLFMTARTSLYAMETLVRDGARR